MIQWHSKCRFSGVGRLARRWRWANCGVSLPLRRLGLYNLQKSTIVRFVAGMKSPVLRDQGKQAWGHTIVVDVHVNLVCPISRTSFHKTSRSYRV
jgi:hypothetical protein